MDGEDGGVGGQQKTDFSLYLWLLGIEALFAFEVLVDMVDGLVTGWVYL